MLSRVADALYWMGRYIERAENVARLVLVTSEVSTELEGLDDELAQAEWDTVLAAVPGGAGATLDFSPSAGLSVPYVTSLLLDDENPISVRHSLGRARENARSIREVLTREIFSNLNEAWRELEAQRRRRMRDPADAHDRVSQTHQAILTTLGAIEHTLTRDQGWSFMKLGEAIERTQRTLLVLRSKLPTLRAESGGIDLPLFYARWRSLLRSLASLENFRQVHGAGLEPDAVTRFLLFHPATPRSVRCGVSRMKHYLDALPTDRGLTPAGRTLGKMLSVITYDEERVLDAPDLSPFLDEAIAHLAEAHDQISRQYFPS